MSRKVREAMRAFRWKVAMVIAPWDDPSSDPHRSVVVEGIELDEGIADFVAWCWANGIKTDGSCEGSETLHKIVGCRSAPVTGFEAYVLVLSVEDALTVSAALAPFELHIPPIVSYPDDGSPYWFVSFSPEALRRWREDDRVEA